MDPTLMRLIFATALITFLPVAASAASCGDYDGWSNAQRAHEEGASGLDGGINPDEPDGIACEGNRGFPGDREARREIEKIREKLEEQADMREERAREERGREATEESDRPRQVSENDDAGLSCNSFTTQRDAQTVFDADPERYALLDGDDDGEACEALGSGIARFGGPQSERDRRPDGSKPFYLNTYETDGVGVAPRRGLSTADWPGSSGCPKYRRTTSRTNCN